MDENKVWKRSFFAAIAGLSARPDLDYCEVVGIAVMVADEAEEVVSNREWARDEKNAEHIKKTERARWEKEQNEKANDAERRTA